MVEDHDELARQLLQICQRRGVMVATAESCTGGWVAKVLTDLPGSSAMLDRGFVTYSNEAKMELLDVTVSTLETHGAVSRETVLEMTAGALTHSRAQFTVAISGIAGPGGGSPDKPVGTVWFAWRSRDGATEAQRQHFEGDRGSVRAQAVTTALTGLIALAT